ncbi:MAG: hypothetical protein ABW140_16790, partial [Candidatus Sedimenticola sp. 6PFRAG1]
LLQAEVWAASPRKRVSHFALIYSIPIRRVQLWGMVQAFNPKFTSLTRKQTCLEQYRNSHNHEF